MLQKTLRDIEGAHPGLALERRRRDDALVHHRAIEREVVGTAEAFAEPVGVEDGDLGDLGQSVPAVQCDVRPGAKQHERVAMPGMDATNRLSRRRVPERFADTHRPRSRQQLDEVTGDGDRSSARPPAAVRGRKRLVQIEVDDVKAHVPGAHDAEDRVQVGAVVVQKPPDAVDHLCDFEDLFFEQAERVRVREHHPGNVSVQDLGELFTIDQPAPVRPYGQRPSTRRASPRPGSSRAPSPG